MSMNISQLLTFAYQNKASDLHLSAGMPPCLRIHGDVPIFTSSAASPTPLPAHPR